MLKTAFVAAALSCLSVSVHGAECLTIAGFADALLGNEKGARIIEVVPVKSAAIDYLVIFTAENGNVLMIPEFAGCMFGQPILIDTKRQEEGA